MYKKRTHLSHISASGRVFRFPWWYYVCFWALVVLSLGFWYGLLASPDLEYRNQSQHLTPGRVAIVDPDRIIRDSIGRRPIVANRINLALIDDAVTTHEAMEKLDGAFRSSRYRMVAYDTVICRFQFEVNHEDKPDFRERVRGLFPEQDVLIWDEYLFATTAAFNDPYFQDTASRWYLDCVGIPQAWDITTGDSSVVVAVLDNGFDLQHEELKGRCINPYNTTTCDENVLPQAGIQGFEHGTHVASTLGGSMNNNRGLSGVSPAVSIMPVKVMDRNGIIAASYVIDGLLYAIRNGADIINLSLGMECDPALSSVPSDQQQEIVDRLFKDEEAFWKELFGYMEERNILCVMAAGNSSVIIGLDPMLRSGNTIIVSAIDQSNQRAQFSNYGPRSTISAPGVAILNAAPGNRYTSLDGTSMACPIVAGILALLKSVDKSVTTQQTLELLRVSAKPISGPVGPLVQAQTLLTMAGNRAI
jgi:subtilisin family serine protease